MVHLKTKKDKERQITAASNSNDNIRQTERKWEEKQPEEDLYMAMERKP